MSPLPRLTLLAGLFLTLLFLLPGRPPAAQPAGTDAASLVLTGGESSTTLSLDALRALPATTLDVAFLTSRGEEKARYTGVLLWDVLRANGLIDGSRHHGELRQMLRVAGRDGNVVLFSGGEIAPGLGNEPILLAYARDGTPLAPDTGIRLIVPGDTRGARSVVDVAIIDVRTPESMP